MTASFTRYYKNTNLAAICLCLLMLAVTAWAADSRLTIKSAELVPVEEQYLLNADFELNLGDDVEDALNRGVQLNFLIEFQLTSPRKYWFDDEIITLTSQFQLPRALAAIPDQPQQASADFFHAG